MLPNTEPVQVLHVAAGPRSKLPERITYGAPPEAPKWPVATSEDPVLTYEDPYGRKIGDFTLAPVLGRGYDELRITLMARKIGEALPPEAVRPSCPDDAHCVFPLRKPHVVALADDSLMKLVPRGNGIALVARALKLEQPATVELVYSRENEEISRKKISLLSDYWSGKPM
jgi:hypothetical protein